MCIRDSYCGGFSCCGARALGAWASVVVARELSSCGMRLSCSAACGIFPDQGSNPCRLHWQADSEPLRHQGSPTLCLLISTFCPNRGQTRRKLLGEHRLRIRWLVGEPWGLVSSNQANLTLRMGLLAVPHTQPRALAPRTMLENFCQTGLFGLALDGYYTLHFLFC